MGLLSEHEAIVWQEFQRGLSTSEIAKLSQEPRWLYRHGLVSEDDKEKSFKTIQAIKRELAQARSPAESRRIQRRLDRYKSELGWSSAYVSRVLSRARKKIERTLRDHATSHRLDVESVLDYKGLLIGFDYQANTQVFIVFTLRLGVVVWYKHNSYAGKLCHECPKEKACRETLDTVIQEYNLRLREDETGLPMTQQSILVFHKLAAKEVPRYRRKESK